MEPTIYKPSIYKSHTIYKAGAEGGGGGGGGGVLPDGYTNILGVYIPNGVSNNANSYINLHEIGISTTDFSGIKIELKLYQKEVLESNTGIPLIKLSNGGSSPYIAIQKMDGSIDDFNRIYARNGGAEAYNTMGRTLGVFNASIRGSTARIGGGSVTCDYNPPVNLSSPRINPFVCYNAGYYAITNNIATLSYKVYDANDNLILCFIPVKKEENGYFGLYDIVHDIFCGNSYIAELKSIS